MSIQKLEVLTLINEEITVKKSLLVDELDKEKYYDINN